MSVLQSAEGPPGAHAFWKGVAKARILDVDLREQVVDVAGQEIMTADKVTLRLNAVVNYKVADPLKDVSAVAHNPPITVGRE